MNYHQHASASTAQNDEIETCRAHVFHSRILSICDTKIKMNFVALFWADQPIRLQFVLSCQEILSVCFTGFLHGELPAALCTQGTNCTGFNSKIEENILIPTCSRRDALCLGTWTPQFTERTQEKPPRYWFLQKQLDLWRNSSTNVPDLFVHFSSPCSTRPRLYRALLDKSSLWLLFSVQILSVSFYGYFEASRLILGQSGYSRPLANYNPTWQCPYYIKYKWAPKSSACLCTWETGLCLVCPQGNKTRRVQHFCFSRQLVLTGNGLDASHASWGQTQLLLLHGVGWVGGLHKLEICLDQTKAKKHMWRKLLLHWQKAVAGWMNWKTVHKNKWGRGSNNGTNVRKNQTSGERIIFRASRIWQVSWQHLDWDDPANMQWQRTKTDIWQND